MHRLLAIVESYPDPAPQGQGDNWRLRHEIQAFFPRYPAVGRLTIWSEGHCREFL